MDQKSSPFFSMVVLSLTLMTLIVITQFFTNQATQALRQGNEKAVTTFRINGGIQDLVNLSFDLQSKFKILHDTLTEKRVKTLRDSLTMLGYNANVLTTATSIESKNLSTNINNLIDSQITMSESIIETALTANTAARAKTINLMIESKVADKVYASCLSLQLMLKDNLQETLNKNTEQAKKLSTYNRILAIFTIFIILFFASIIIRRQTQQYKLIQELRLAEAAALKSKYAKDEFLANMSHELRTPLNALIGFGNLLKDTNLDLRQKEYVDMVRTGGKNLLSIVNDVLDLSKIEAGKLTLAHQPFDLYKFFEQLEKLFSGSIKEKSLYYHYSIDNAVPQFVIGDPERLQQIFVNLISNAIKFTSTGGIKVESSVIWADETTKKYKLVFSVKDSGSGIPNSKVETIFERFEQLEQGKQRQFGGTGLGLTIVKNLVGKMGGAISVFSQVEEGSAFTFTCVLEKSDVVSIDSNTDPVQEISFLKHNILVAEDNKTNQTLLKHLFKKHKLNVQMVDNGKEAVELLRSEKFELIFMDIQMPEMDGYTAINIIRKRLNNTTPIIAMTAYVTETEINKCRAAGFTDYLSKPLDEKLLIDITSKYLGIEERNNKMQEDAALSYLKSLVGNNDAALREILMEMDLQWQKDKAEILHYAQQNDRLKLNQLMHRLKSTFSPLGTDNNIYKTIDEESHFFANETDPFDKYANFVEKIDSILDVILKKKY